MNKRFIKQLFRLLIPYTLIIIFIFSLTSFAYLKAFKKIEASEIQIQDHYIEQSKMVLDRQFEEAFTIIDQLANTPIIRAFAIYDDYDHADRFSPVMELQKTVDNFQVVNNIVDSYFIFYKKSEVVVSSSALFNYQYFDNVYNLYGHENKATFWHSLFHSNFQVEIQKPMDYENGQYKILPIKSSIGHGAVNTNATIYMQLSSEKLRENMIGYDQDFDGNFFILDEYSRVLLSLNNEHGIRENTMVDLSSLEDDLFLVSAHSDVIPYTYVLIQPKESVYAEFNQYRLNSYLSLLAIFLGGILVSIILARYNTKPMVKLMDNNELLATRVENQLPYLRSNFIEKWLKGDYVSIEDITAITRFLKTDFVGNYYSVAVIDYQEHIDIFDDNGSDQFTEAEAKKLIIHDLLTDSLIKPEFFHTLDNNHVALIFVSKADDIEDLEAHITDTILACDDILTEAGMDSVHYGLGGIGKEMTYVPTSYTEAYDAVSYSLAKDESNICWFKDIEIIQDICYYPPEVELRLYNCIRAGESTQLIEILRDLFQKNIVEKNLSQQMQQIFIYEMCGTLVKLQQRTFGDDTLVNEVISNALKTMKDMTDLKQIQYCKQIFIEICDIYSTKQGNRHAILMEKIDLYITNHFHDPDFGLHVIADEFNVSYTYLSEIIKDFKDMNFINYLQNLRMDKAKELLEMTDMQVKEIFTQCGYNSSNSFGKAFKRIHGVTASAYRDKYRSDHR